MPLDFDIFGHGVYTPKQAARLVQGKSAEILRWTRGRGLTSPLWNATYQSLGDATELSFLDLIEVRVVKAMRANQITLQQIRFAMAFASNELGIERPLSKLDFKTDGAEILFKALDKDDQLVSLSPKRPGQKVFSKIIEQSLNDLEYDDGHLARWRPADGIVLDPTRSFGSPILDSYGLSSEIIFEEHLTGFTAKNLANIYEVPLDAIKAAIKFEKHLEQQQQRQHGKSTV